MLENAFDTSVAKRVKRAYTSLDSFGLRTGMYLRRYPLLRTILFVYVVSIIINTIKIQFICIINIKLNNYIIKIIYYVLKYTALSFLLTNNHNI